MARTGFALDTRPLHLDRKPVTFKAGMRIQFGEHFAAQARAKGFTNAQIKDALGNPYKITAVTRYPGQWRFCGRGVDGQPGIAVVVAFDREVPSCVTAYLDGVVTAMREDQRGDFAAVTSRRLTRYQVID